MVSHKELGRAFDFALTALAKKEREHPGDVFGSMCSQISFVRNCIERGKSIDEELQGRSLNFHLLSGRNLAGPGDKELIESISMITEFLVKY